MRRDVEFYAAKIDEFVMDGVWCFGTRTWTRPQTQYSKLELNSARVGVRLEHGVGFEAIDLGSDSESNSPTRHQSRSWSVSLSLSRSRSRSRSRSQSRSRSRSRSRTQY